MNPFKGSARYGATPAPETPYQRAGQAWDERIGSARVQAANWRYAALGLLLANTALSGSLAWLAARGSITPWVVQVDKLGEPRIVAPAALGAKPADAAIAWALSRFIADVRTRSIDPVLMRQAWLRAYDFVEGDGAATLSDYARRADPFGEAAHTQVLVEVTNVVRASPTSFRVTWTEQRFTAGERVGVERWVAVLGVSISTPRTPEGLRANPLGVRINAIAWSKEFGA
ncbi:conjugal transfer protein TrbF [Caulobacter sp. UNC279MFTsu5.1]|uniref:conjugal transfer protein TrbF n=1 Tax=Caulobacter sp. UNC279MFTsu5.1 TaxID=1502775 RepID=UPI000382CB35|nr:conjugal transfer protein TrbF [Caulobacter sp. UNC279MFTsu5.1]SFI56387.1 type IV secretion system protein VirB5 [Caulobacter sp. UNC279MFTsu5.1]